MNTTIARAERRRCRAGIPYAQWRGFTTVQCDYIATQLRVLRPENRELPVCGVHARAESAYEYRPVGVTSLAVEAVVR